MAVEHETSLFEDPTTWVGVAIVAFLVLAVTKIWPKLAAALDGYSANIRAEIENANALKAEAQALLVQTQRKAAEAERMADEILERAKFEAKQIADEAEKEIEREIERKMKLAEDKIKRAEDAALENVRRKAVESAIEAAREILEGELAKSDKKQKLIDKSIKLISSNVA